MGIILKLTDGDESWYLEWSAVSNSPISWGMGEAAFKAYYLYRYGEVSAPEFEERVARAHVHGTSSRLGVSVEETVSGNCVGEDGKELSVSELTQKLCREAPPREIPCRQVDLSPATPEYYGAAEVAAKLKLVVGVLRQEPGCGLEPQEDGWLDGLALAEWVTQMVKERGDLLDCRAVGSPVGSASAEEWGAAFLEQSHRRTNLDLRAHESSQAYIKMIRDLEFELSVYKSRSDGDPRG